MDILKVANESWVQDGTGIDETKNPPAVRRAPVDLPPASTG